VVAKKKRGIWQTNAKGTRVGQHNMAMQQRKRREGCVFDKGSDAEGKGKGTKRGLGGLVGRERVNSKQSKKETRQTPKHRG
jgi:hypothetical protein